MSMVGLSLEQPGPWSVLRAGCRVLNLPEGVAPPKHRGEVLLHAALVCPHDDFDEANRRMLRMRALPSGVLLPWRADLPRGGFVARARIVGVVSGDAGDPWSLPGVIGLVLADVSPLPAFVPAPAPTTQGLAFQVDDELFARALALATTATTDAELAAVADVWRTTRRGPRSRRAPVGVEARV